MDNNEMEHTNVLIVFNIAFEQKYAHKFEVEPLLLGLNSITITILGIHVKSGCFSSQ